ncbi:hypothetical protein BDW59DRAFT_177142 [Aspergillus cavernicola]|uniref:Peptidase M43 pregnancy-associated plasma-A domain-containing protein n=1 Tax=Aspergillus cavernicola TaxID=176166 RepID=A0ABR4J4A8_9EURO
MLSIKSSVLLGFSSLASAITRCGSAPPSDAIRALHSEYEAEENSTSAPENRDRITLSTTIDTYVHIIQHESAPVDLTARISVLNTRFADSNTGFMFNLVSQQDVQNDNWRNVEPGSPQELDMKSTLRQGRYRDLNIYVDTISDGSILGYAQFPEENPDSTTLALDGVVVIPDSLPGGTGPYGLGLTTVHEVGHWLSLFHTFQPDPIVSPDSGCNGAGDYIIDTPAEDSPASACPEGRDSCPIIPGLDPIRNYMDYSGDACLDQFTMGQAMRMRTMFMALRAMSPVK